MGINKIKKILLKSKEQIKGIRKSSQLAGKVLLMIQDYVKPGISTLELDNIIGKYITDHGAVSATLGYYGYPKSSCISLNEVVCHGIPRDDTILKNGDILNIDITTILGGYFGDTSKMYTVGKISDTANKLIKAAKHSMDLGIQQVYPKNVFGNIGFVIGNYVHSQKFSVVYEYCGHGVGVEFHEEPQVNHSAPKNSGPKMRPGMIFTIEPMINEGNAPTHTDKKDGWTVTTKDKKLSAQFEHTILVTENGFDILSDVSGECKC